MKILAVCIGNAEKLPGKSYKTGIYKAPLRQRADRSTEGLVGDAICNRKHHGGVDQAVYVEGSLTLDWWSKELGRDRTGHVRRKPGDRGRRQPQNLRRRPVRDGFR
jgi:MOSC domain-containing protein YiiM